MRKYLPTRCLHAVIILLALALTSCGGGTTTAGTGGSGIGGTGITRVSGNVAQVVGTAPIYEQGGAEGNLFATVASWVSRSASAQSDTLAGIRVSGGGKTTITDFRGDFELVGVTPSDNFSLTFAAPDSPSIVLPVGAVSRGAAVRIKDIVLDTESGVAQAAAIEVRQNPGGSTPNGGDACEPGSQGQGDPGAQGQGNPCPSGPDGANPGGGQGNNGQGQSEQGQGQSNQGQSQGHGQGQGQSNKDQGKQGQANS